MVVFVLKIETSQSAKVLAVCLKVANGTLKAQY